MPPPFDPAGFNPVPGRSETLSPGLRRVLAPNPSAMTFRGTNTYLVGTGAVAVIDPGPALPDHLDAILAALAPDERISHVFVTHSHVDHSPLARELARVTGAPVLAFGDSRSGMRPRMRQLAAQGVAGGGEGVDADFAPDVTLADGAVIEGGDWALRALWTPGHLGNHLCFAWGDEVFSGDLAMGWASSLISPPEGDLGAYMASLARLRGLGARRLHPGHGAPVEDPAARLEDLISHRRSREAEIIRALRLGPATIEALTRTIYTDVAPQLLPAASRNVLSHIIDLMDKNSVVAEGSALLTSRFHLAAADPGAS
ncbi:metallo-beta-lactamase [Defluviimonas sp. 20V17]|uniref:Hydroxyacylglutathione hydrolase n=1 Tax=Allgaiera indica TaxID=765699 RepID=A0AAN5A0F0_9RHOB|nr:MBL fold metallo-hydrolase [Allgaiera indica]KDB05428.1 metallo-beta-lactamase [Defluviimonas sp. 20V17]GHE04092.1 MBL fold hydrolase [Allgaiera indica]SDX49183.1 hydroxyacylglutathione hydrolase [Allgaiera indica]